MFLPLVHVSLPDMRAGWSPEAHFAPMTFMLEGLVKLNEWHIDQSFKRAQRLGTPPIPPLFETGIRYQEDPQGREDWRDIMAILEHVAKTGKGIDCDNIIGWRCAELRYADRLKRGLRFEDELPNSVVPVIKWQHLTQDQARQFGYFPSTSPGDKGIPPEGLWLVHCVARFPSGAIEDTSKILGMGGSYTSRA